MHKEREIMKIGDIVDYSGKGTGQKSKENCIIEFIDNTFKIFNQPMATLVDVNHWVPLTDLKLKDKTFTLI